MSTDDIHHHIANKNDPKDKTFFLIDVPKTKNNKPRQFIIPDQGDHDNDYQIFKKYTDLRPPNTPHKRFFVAYRNGKCSRQPVGKNTIAGFPKKIATFLCLPNAQRYTGHCLRRTSATTLAAAGANMIGIMHHGGWNSSSVAQGYLEQSLKTKLVAADMISTSLHPGTPQLSHPEHASKSDITEDAPSLSITEAFMQSDAQMSCQENGNFVSHNLSLPGPSRMIFQNLTNCTFNFNMHTDRDTDKMNN